MDLKTIIICLCILFVHWIGDFVLQTDEQAKGKSKEWKPLLEHTGTYSLIWFGFMFIFHLFHHGHQYELVILFPFITFICHTAQDYCTSRLNAQLHAEGKIHEFFVAVGFDQLLHFIQLFLTYYFLVK